MATLKLIDGVYVEVDETEFDAGEVVVYETKQEYVPKRKGKYTPPLPDNKFLGRPCYKPEHVNEDGLTQRYTRSYNPCVACAKEGQKKYIEVRPEVKEYWAKESNKRLTRLRKEDPEYRKKYQEYQRNYHAKLRAENPEKYIEYKNNRTKD